MITQEQLKDVQSRVADLARYLDIEGKKIQVEEEELRTHVADFWDDRKRAEAQMKKIKDLKGNPLLVFANSWSVNMVLERNEGLKLSEFGRN